jgi:hypothetical protein
MGDADAGVRNTPWPIFRRFRILNVVQVVDQAFAVFWFLLNQSFLTGASGILGREVEIPRDL